MKSGADIVVSERTYGEVLDAPMALPAINVASDALEQSVRRDPGPRLSFRLHVADPTTEWQLIPFHRIAHERCNLYWQLATAAAPGTVATGRMSTSA